MTAVLGIDASVGPRFWAKVDTSGTCWTWTGGINHQGYGKFWLEGHTLQAHRVAYLLRWGAVPEDLTLDHLCRNRPCVRPSHLEPVTIQENLLRSPLRPEKRTHCPNGHSYNLANTYISARGDRFCRRCHRDRMRQRRAGVR